VTEPVVDLLSEEWHDLDDLCSSLDDGDWATVTECPGWDVHDQLAHVIGTESALAGEPAPPLVEPAPSHVANPIGAANEAWVDSMRSLPPAELLDRYRRVVAKRLQQLRGAAPERFDEIGPSPVGPAPYREFMRVRLMDTWVHEQDIRRAIARPGNLTGDVADHSIARFVSAMPFVVGKKAGAPDGSSVVFALTGPAARTFAVAVVDGRAKVVEEVPAAPTATIETDAETWWTLALGRRDPAAALGGGLVTLSGDVDLGRRVVEGLSFMI
jgi:uncharacterized protein (TIGR03083 family)